MKEGQKSRFPLIMLGSVGAHLAVLALLYGAWAYHAVLGFSGFTFGDDGQNQFKVAGVDRTKPLFLPKGFYAIVTPPDIVKKHEDKPKTDDKKKAVKDDDAKKGEDDADKDKKDDADKKDAPKPADSQATDTGNGFGHISGNAFRPHLENIYKAYEEGRIKVDTFSVTVACKAQSDGSLTDIAIVKSSGDDLIDKTAINIIKELGAMHALKKLSALSSLSITLAKTPSSASLTAVGFANDPDVSQGLANELSFLKFVSKAKMTNDDQTKLLNGVKIDTSGNRVSVSLDLPSSVAGDMMKRSFGPHDTAKSGA